MIEFIEKHEFNYLDLDEKDDSKKIINTYKVDNTSLV